MNTPTLSEITGLLVDAQPYLVGAGGVLTTVLIVMAVARTARPRAAKSTQTETEPGGFGAVLVDGAEALVPGKRGHEARKRMRPEDYLTFVVALIAAGVAAQGMWNFFADVLHFPKVLRAIAFGVLELITFTCALRARRNIVEAEKPEDAKAGVDGIAVWVITALSGSFSAMDAKSISEAVFRLVMPLVAAWLWERGMSIERRRVRGGSAIHLRLTPERVLVWLRIAEPSGRTASEVDAYRRLNKVAKAAARVRSLRGGGWDLKGVRLGSAQRRLDRAMRSAVAHAGLAADPGRQRALIAQLGSMYNAGALAELTPEAPWAGFTSLVQRTGFMVQGHEFTPLRFMSPATVVHTEVQEPVQPQVRDQVQQEVHENGDDVHRQRRELEPPPEPEPQPTSSTKPTEPRVHEPRPSQNTKVQSPAANLSAKKASQVQAVVDLIHDRGYDAVTLTVVQNELGFKKGTAYNRLTEARELVNQDANQKAVNQ